MAAPFDLTNLRDAADLERALSGATDVAPEIADLAGLAQRVAALPVPGPDPAFVASLGARLQAEAAAPGPSTPAGDLPPNVVRIHRAWPKAVAGTAAGLVAASAVIGVASQAALPGDALYGVRGSIDALEANLAGSDESRGTTLLAQAREHVDDTRTLAARTPMSAADIARSLDDAAAAVTAGEDALFAAYDATGSPKALAAVAEFTAWAKPRVTELRGKVPASAVAHLEALSATVAAGETRLNAALASCGQACADIPRPGVAPTPTDIPTTPAPPSATTAPTDAAATPSTSGVPGAVLPGVVPPATFPTGGGVVPGTTPDSPFRNPDVPVRRTPVLPPVAPPPLPPVVVPPVVPPSTPTSPFTPPVVPPVATPPVVPPVTTPPVVPPVTTPPVVPPATTPTTPTNPTPPPTTPTTPTRPTTPPPSDDPTTPTTPPSPSPTSPTPTSPSPTPPAHTPRPPVGTRTPTIPSPTPTATPTDTPTDPVVTTPPVTPDPPAPTTSTPTSTPDPGRTCPDGSPFVDNCGRGSRTPSPTLVPDPAGDLTAPAIVVDGATSNPFVVADPSATTTTGQTAP